MVESFIKHGASLDVQDIDGWAPLFACKSLSMAEYLIGQGADPVVTDQCDFPCWNMIDDQATQDFLMKEAKNRGLHTWTTLD